MNVDSFNRDTQTCLLDAGVWHIKYSCLTHSGSDTLNIPVWHTVGLKQETCLSDAQSGGLMH